MLSKRTDPKRANDPTVLILTSLAAGPKHGHALLRDIEGFAGVRLGPGSLYGAITRLEERGLIVPLPADDRRQPYDLTADGRVVLAEHVAELRRIIDTANERLSVGTRQAATRRGAGGRTALGTAG